MESIPDSTFVYSANGDNLKIPVYHKSVEYDRQPEGMSLSGTTPLLLSKYYRQITDTTNYTYSFIRHGLR